MDVLEVLRSGGVQRYHALPEVPCQSNAEHQWGVTVIFLYLTQGTADLQFPLLHDAGEIVTGDVGYDFKRAHAEVKAALDAAEDAWRHEQGITSIPDAIKPLVKTADYLEGAWYCWRNNVPRVARIFLDAAYPYLVQIDGTPAYKRAVSLWQQLHVEVTHVTEQ